jgi:hypothetical protein
MTPHSEAHITVDTELLLKEKGVQLIDDIGAQRRR